jgi:hypothetical protein
MVDYARKSVMAGKTHPIRETKYSYPHGKLICQKQRSVGDICNELNNRHLTTRVIPFDLQKSLLP